MKFDIHIPNPACVPAYQNKIESEYGIGLIAAVPDTQVVGQKAAVLPNYFFFLSGLLSKILQVGAVDLLPI